MITVSDVKMFGVSTQKYYNATLAQAEKLAKFYAAVFAPRSDGSDHFAGISPVPSVNFTTGGMVQNQITPVTEIDQTEGAWPPDLRCHLVLVPANNPTANISALCNVAMELSQLKSNPIDYQVSTMAEKIGVYWPLPQPEWARVVMIDALKDLLAKSGV
jgi:hypothetical protein